MERRFEPQNAKMQEFPDNLAGLPGNSDCCADSAALAEQPCFSTPRKAHHFLGGTFAMILSSEVSFSAFQIMCMCARARVFLCWSSPGASMECCQQNACLFRVWAMLALLLLFVYEAVLPVPFPPRVHSSSDSLPFCNLSFPIPT